MAHVATFYSFKGGVGRSLLVANVGWRLASSRKVLLWDLDLEAPGLHNIPALRPAQAERGFLEWVRDWHEGAALLGSGSLSEQAAAELRALVQPVPGRSNLAILPAFGDGAETDFAGLYAEGPWRRLLEDEPALGLALFDACIEVLGEKRDHLLIDSRTGITDIGGFLGALIPHTTVLVGGFGHQSVYGLSRVKAAFEKASRHPLRARLGAGSDLDFIQVISPVPADESQSAERRYVWREVMGELQPIEVSFDPRLLWSEELLAATDPESKTAAAYRQVAERLSGLRERFLAATEEDAESAEKYPEQRGADPLSGRQEKGRTFEGRVRRLLELHGYSVAPEQILGGNKVDLVATKSAGLTDECWWVECKDHRRAVGKEVLEKLAGWIGGKEGRSQGARGMVVAKGFSPAAVSYAEDHPELQLWTVDELERRLFDPTPYLHALVSGWEKSELGRTYVEQQVLRVESLDEEAENLLDHAGFWARGLGPRLWLLLGDYGTGKSVFFQRLAAELARRALDDSDEPFPIAIDLKRFANATSLETLLYEHLRRRIPGYHGDPEVILHLLSTGRCVLLLDGFDEMGLAAAGRGIEEQFREMAKLVNADALDPKRGNRVLITCRTHFFRDQQQVKDTASGRLQAVVAAEDSALGRLARRFNASIDELLPFGEEEIERFLVLHLGEPDALRALDFIRNTYDLLSLARRPVLLEMIVKSLPKLWKDERDKVTPAGLYEIYTRLWLEDRSSLQLQTRPEQRYELLMLLAVVLWRREERQIHHRELLAEIERLADHFRGLDHERVDIELRTAAFLIRSSEGYYRFSHKSFLEYFLARRLDEALTEGDVAALDLPPLTPEVADFFWQMADEEAEEQVGRLRAILEAPYRSGRSENALRLIAFRASVSAEKGSVLELQGARLGGAQLTGLDLRGLDLPGADLHAARLEGANLEGVVLDNANLHRARMERVRAAGASLAGADLTGAALSQADLRRADLVGANLARAILRDADLSQADLSSTRLHGADLSFASGDGTCFEKAELQEANLESSVWTACSWRDASFARTDLGSKETGWLALDSTGRPAELPAELLPGGITWPLRTGLRTGHRSWVRSVSWSSDGSRLASGSEDGTVRVWDVSTGEVRQELSGSGGIVWSVSWSSDGSRLASGSEDGTVRVWDVSTGEVRQELSGSGGRVRSVSWSSDGSRLASGSEDGTVRVWDVSTGEVRQELSGSGGIVLSVSWSSDGSRLASGSEDGTVRVWDVSTGEVRQELSGSGGRVWSVSWSSDGSRLASGSEDGTVRVWDVSTGEVRQELSGSGGSVLSVSWSSDGSRLASGSEDGTVRVWDVSTGEVRQELSGSGGRVWSVSWSSDGSRLASGSDDGTVRVWDVSTGEVRQELSGSGGSVWSVSWSSDGSRLASGSEDGTVRVWDVSTGEVRQELSGSGGIVLSVSWSSDGSRLASGSEDGTVRVWDVSTGEVRQELSGSGGRVWSVSWSSDGSRLASGSEDGTVRVWDVSTGEVRQELSGSGGIVLSVSWSSDGSRLASGSEDGTVRVWDVSTGEVRQELSGSGGSVWSVSWSSDGSRLASGSEDGTVRVWDVSTGEVRQELSGSGGRVWSVSWSSDGSRLASGSDDGTVRVWDVSTGEVRQELSGSGGRVWSVSWSSDGSRLASGSDDGTVRVWDASTGRQLCRLEALGRQSLCSLEGGWFVRGGVGGSADPRFLALFVESSRSATARSWRVLPIAGLAHWLERPDLVRRALGHPPQLPEPFGWHADA